MDVMFHMHLEAIFVDLFKLIIENKNHKIVHF